MAVTALDPKTALVVIDLQQGILALPMAHPVEQVVKNARLLADAFRSQRLPVVLVTVSGAPSGRTERTRPTGARPAGWADLVPELNQQPQDQTFVKRQWGAFRNTGLEQYLQDLDVTQVVIAGVSTSIGVESTARHAHECGFNLTLAVDAMTDTDIDAHLNSITRIFPRLGETGTTAQIIGLLGGTHG
jgi:nicotinamidase-related amidase